MMICLVWTTQIQTQSMFEFEGDKIAPGSKKHITITLSDTDEDAIIPITIFHGSNDGPVLGITAGVHGYEYAPILAGQSLISTIDPKSMNGTVILVQIANVGSFLGRSPYVNPLDKKNLNRSFPGDSKGTITERIAAFITQNIITRCDYFVDVHSGDAPEDLMAYSAYYQHDDFPKISAKGRQMASHMGFDHVVVFKTKGKEYMLPTRPSLYCSAEAFKQHIPAIDIECGRLGLVEKVYVDKIINGIESLLKYLEMIEGEPLTPSSIALIGQRHTQSSAHTGFFYPDKSSGDYVLKGMKLGHITNFFGQHMHTVYAEESGIILYMIGTPPIQKGETLANIGVINKN